MISLSSLRWRLVAWIVGVMLVVSAIVFVVVYEQTGSQLRAQAEADVSGDIGQLSEAVRSLRATSSAQLLAQLRNYLRAQPYNGTSSLLFAVVPGHGTISNHPELFGSSRVDDGESAAEQQLENARGRALLSGPVGRRTALVPDVGKVRFDEEVIIVAGVHVRLGAGESLESVSRAQRSVARSFLIAGALGLILVLIAAYLAGASVSAPLRRMARVAARVDDGDLHPRMKTPPSASREIRVLAESFNHMLDRLAAAFGRQRDFIADASHELRTPLTVIGSQLEVLAAEHQPSGEEIRRVQRLVSAEIARTSRLVDDMLLLASSDRRDFLRREPIELRVFISDLWSTTTAGHERRLELGPVPPGTLEADPDRLAQALRNLIDNALAHTAAPAGLVRLQTTALPGAVVRFSIVDDGPGVPEEHRARIFERFHRTDDSRARVAGGSGLGLAIVQAIAEAHGGSVRAVPGQAIGARFELEIPGLSVTSGRPGRHDPSRQPGLARSADAG
ncbi:MAG: sensor histidine kinase [Solirubrobacteraceae bacterium]